MPKDEKATSSQSLSDTERLDIAIACLLSAGGLHKEHFRERGQLKEWDDIEGGLTSITVRSLNQTDNLIFDAIQLLRSDFEREQ